MKLKTGLTRSELRHHLQYHGWQYLLAVGLSIMLVNLIYTQTAYRPPRDKRIVVYIQSSVVGAEQANAFLEPFWKAAVPAMESVEAVMLLPSSGENDYYANIRLVTYLAAADGDLYLLNLADFKRLASQGAFLTLDLALSEDGLEGDHLNLAAGKVQPVESAPDGSLTVTGEPRLFGIPLSGLDSLAEGLGVAADQTVLSAAVNGGNVGNSLILLKALVARGQDEGSNQK